MAGLTVQNFVSAAVGITVLFAFIRGLRAARTETPAESNTRNASTTPRPQIAYGLGNFWADVARVTACSYAALVDACCCLFGRVPQNFSAYKTVALVEPLITQDGATIGGDRGPMGPQASQVAPNSPT